MNEPTVCCIMLTRDRPELAKRAVECFRAQTYQNAALYIYSTSEVFRPGALGMYEQLAEPATIVGRFISHHHYPGNVSLSIGSLRNLANAAAGEKAPDILIHWDDDDWSHPNRIAEQVALLQSSGVDVVGYSDMLFWREPHAEYGQKVKDPHGPGMLDTATLHPGEAWLYTATKGCAPALGTSLCYWRKTWEKNPFPDQPKPGNMGSEYGNWLKALKCETRTSIERVCVGATVRTAIPSIGVSFDSSWESQPRMIARIHAGNGSRDAYQLEKLVEGGSREWHRAPQWDEIVRGILA